MNLTGSIIDYLLKRIFAGIMFLSAVSTHGQNSNGSLSGVTIDTKSKEPLIGATVILIGTYKGAITNENGVFRIQDIKPGDYSIKITYLGYADKIYNGITIKAGQDTKLDADLTEITATLNAVEIVGEKELINLEDAKSQTDISAEEIKESNAKEVKDVVKMQNGVSQNPDGIQIRGGRVYETQYMVDGVNAQDPLAGTGFGVDVSSNAVSNVSVVTGGMDVEYGNGSSGAVITKIKEGTDSLTASASWQRDNLGIKPHNKSGWNTDIINLGIGGPLPGLKKKVKFFTNFYSNLSDDYFGYYADQLHSSLFKNTTRWAPRYSNQWSHTFKLSYDISKSKKLTITNQHSLNISQSTRALQVVGNNAILQPGFQYEFSLDLDNAATYTHQSNLTAINFKNNISDRWQMNVSVGRLFTNLRADANGRPFRDPSSNKVYDPASIVTNPVTLYNPQDTAVYVYPGPGLYNNGGLTPVWHDHYVREYSLKTKFHYFPVNKYHIFTFGQEHLEQEYQWVDISKPWVGAPIKVNDTTTTPSTRIGESSDVWKVNTANGGLFFQDEIRYKGIIAFLGLRYNYWAPGKYADDAINNSTMMTEDQKNSYHQHSSMLLGRRYKSRLLPRIRVSFPVKDNHVLYFNYGHAMKLPHPRFLYAGLDPVYQDRSYLANLGNPDLNPEITVSYELGLRSQINKNFAVSVTAFYNDKYNYIVSRSAQVKDQTGRYVTKTIYINQDYARIRGLEIGLYKRVHRWLKVNLNVAYQVATGKSNSALESKLQIQQTGTVSTSKESFLAWDRPIDSKLSINFKPDSTLKIGNFSLNGFHVFVFSTYKSGLRYTPYQLAGYAPNGRPLYEKEDDKPFSKVGSSWFWTDVKITKDFKLNRHSRFFSLSIEVRNIFDNKNAQIVNPVTGRGYNYGDPLPQEVRDPVYPDPQNNSVPPMNPARYMQPRQVLYGISYLF